MPRLMSFWVVDSSSHLTTYASRGDVPWKAPCWKRFLHEGAYPEANLRPEGLAVWLVDNPLRPAADALLEEEGEPADRDVLPLGGQCPGVVQRAGPPDDVPGPGEGPEAVDAVRVRDTSESRACRAARPMLASYDPTMETSHP
jgi:hypothetical protein